jgi:hypothetical protein
MYMGTSASWIMALYLHPKQWFSQCFTTTQQDLILPLPVRVYQKSPSGNQTNQHIKKENHGNLSMSK